MIQHQYAIKQTFVHSRGGPRKAEPQSLTWQGGAAGVASTTRSSQLSCSDSPVPACCSLPVKRVSLTKAFS